MVSDALVLVATGRYRLIESYFEPVVRARAGVRRGLPHAVWRYARLYEEMDKRIGARRYVGELQERRVFFGYRWIRTRWVSCNRKSVAAVVVRQFLRHGHVVRNLIIDRPGGL